MAYSWEEERKGSGMSSTGGAGFESAREVYRRPVEPVSSTPPASLIRSESTGSRPRSTPFVRAEPYGTPFDQVEAHEAQTWSNAASDRAYDFYGQHSPNRRHL